MKKRLLLLCAFVCSFFSYVIPLQAQPAQEDIQLQNNILDAVEQMQELMQESYIRTEEIIRDIIIEHSLSFELTMDNYYALNNPAEDLDYIAMIAAYTTIKGYYLNHGLLMEQTLTQICDDFYDISYDIYSFDEITPLNIGCYEEIGDNCFVRTDDYYITDPQGILDYEYFPMENSVYYERSDNMVRHIPTAHTVKYADISFLPITADSFFEICDVPLYSMYDRTGDLSVEDVYEYRKQYLSDVILGKYIKQNVFARTRSGISYEDIESYIYALPEDLSGNRVQLIKTALSLVGNVPFQLNGKPVTGGYDESWWVFTDDNTQKGLDSSGFIEWCIRTMDEVSELATTITDVKSIQSNQYLVNIQKGELLPGDIGLINTGGDESGTVHAGIYLGDNEWIHCSPVNRTVIISEYDSFNIFRRIPGIENNDLFTPEIIIYENTYNTSGYEYDDVYLLAQTICSEAWGEGMNGWIGVAEVIRNRIESPAFPYANTVYDVVYAPNQFSDNERIQYYEPPEEIIKVAMDVLSGNLSIFNNPDVLFYKNPMITNNIPAYEDVDWGRHDWYTYINHHAFYLID